MGGAVPEEDWPIPIVLYLSVKLWVMKDFVRVLIMLVLVFAAMAGVVYLNYALNQTTLAVLAGVIAVVIIVLVYRNFQRWFGPR
jgi:zinc transporter ZupT